MFIFLFILFDTRDRYYFESNFRLVLLINVFLTKEHEMLFCSLLNMNKQLSPVSLFLFISLFHWTDIFQKNVQS